MSGRSEEEGTGAKGQGPKGGAGGWGPERAGPKGVEARRGGGPNPEKIGWPNGGGRSVGARRVERPNISRCFPSPAPHVRSFLLSLGNFFFFGERREWKSR